MQRSICLLLASFSLLAVAHPAACQSPTPKSTEFAASLSGASLPLSLKLKDLDGNWRTFSSSDASNQVQSYMAMMTGSSHDTYYTKGETETLGGELYLIAYHQKLSLDMAGMMRGGPSQGPVRPTLTPDTELSLCLLNLHTAGSLNDIQPFSLQEALLPPSPPPAPVMPSAAEASVSNLKQLGLGLIQYTQDNNETLPPMQNASAAKAALFPYIKSESIFEQPPSHTFYHPNASLSRRKLASFDSPATMVVYFETSPQADGRRAVLFLDGHVKRLEDPEWQQLKAASHVPSPPQGVQ